MPTYSAKSNNHSACTYGRYSIGVYMTTEQMYAQRAHKQAFIQRMLSLAGAAATILYIVCQAIHG